MVTINLKLPVNIFVEDYHKFGVIVEALKKFGITGIRYKEIDAACYEAVFYTGTFKGSDAEKLYKKLSDEYVGGGWRESGIGEIDD